MKFMGQSRIKFIGPQKIWIYIWEELKVDPVQKKLAQYKLKWLNRVSRMEDIRYPKQLLDYGPLRRPGRPLKTLLDEQVSYWPNFVTRRRRNKICYLLSGKGHSTHSNLLWVRYTTTEQPRGNIDFMAQSPSWEATNHPSGQETPKTKTWIWTTKKTFQKDYRNTFQI
jgi:hypothetical protein